MATIIKTTSLPRPVCFPAETVLQRRRRKRLLKLDLIPLGVSQTVRNYHFARLLIISACFMIATESPNSCSY